MINAAWCWVLLHRGRRPRSPALVADGRHLLSDVVSSVGVLLGVLLAPPRAGSSSTRAGRARRAQHPVVGLAGHPEVGGRTHGHRRADPSGAIREVISTNAEGAIEAHDLRTRHSGPTTFVEFHLVVPGGILSDAHDICDRLEHAIREAIEPAHITIHVEPENKAKHSGIIVL